VSHAPENVVFAEQNKLEKLIARYKVLIPSIEITMIKTEVFSKCYTYRQDVSTIVALLDKISNQTQGQFSQKPENLSTVKQMIKTQEVAMNQLDAQRGRIMTLLQRGKDLSKDVHAPHFINDEIKNLESGWNQTYSTTQEKLQTLKNVESIWQQYDEHKQEINNLINLAEIELRSVTPLQTNPTNCITDMQNKQQLQVHLQKSAVPIFNKLDQIFEALVAETPLKEEVFLKEMHDLQNRFSRTLDHLKDRVEYLENYNSKWNDYKRRLADLHAWSTHIAPKAIECIQSSDLSPEERKQKLLELEAEFIEKMKDFELLTSDAYDLAPKEGNLVEAKKLKNEVKNLHATMNAISTAIQNNSQVLDQDLDNWHKYQSQVDEIKPWVDDPVKPITVDEFEITYFDDAKMIQNEIEHNMQQCQKKISKLNEIAQVGAEIQLNEFLPNDIDFYQAKYRKHYENMRIMNEKIGTLIRNWQNFNDQIDTINGWIAEKNKFLNEFEGKIQNAQVDELEKFIHTMKFLENEVFGKLTDLTSLMQLSEKINPLTIDGSTNLKSELASVKENIDNVNKRVKANIVTLGGKLHANEEINEKLNSFNLWLEELRRKIDEIDNVSIKNIEPSLHALHLLLEAQEDKKPVFGEIYQDIKTISTHSLPNEKTVVCSTYNTLANSFERISSDLNDKKRFLEKWLELSYMINDVQNFVDHHNSHYVDTTPTAEVQQVLTSVGEYLKNIPNMRAIASDLDKASIMRIKNENGEEKYALPSISKLESELERIKDKCLSTLNKNQEIDDKKKIFKILEKQTIQDLNGFVTEMKNLDAKIDRNEISYVNALQKYIELKDECDKYGAKMSIIHKEGNLLIKDDFNDMINVQEILSVLDKEYNNIKEKCDDAIQNYTILNKLLENFTNAAKKIKDETMGVIVLNDAEISDAEIIRPVLDTKLNHSKKQIDNLRKIKLQIDDLERKGNEIERVCDNIQKIPPNVQDFIQEEKNAWNDKNGKAQVQTTFLESVSSLWQKIDEIANEIYNWLDDIESIIIDSLENKKEVESGFRRLKKYQIELPTFLNLKGDIDSKIASIMKIQDRNFCPKAIRQLSLALDKRFEEISQRIKDLESIAEDFSKDEKDFKLKLKNVNENINRIREKIIEYDDANGEIENVVGNLNKCIALDESLLDNDRQIKELSNLAQVFYTKFENIKNSALPKELENIKKRQSVLEKNNEKAKKILSNCIQKGIKERLMNCLKTIQQQSEKVKWIKPDSSDNKYNLETKLNSLKDIQNTNTECCELIKHIELPLTSIKKLPKIYANEFDEMNNQIKINYGQLVTETEAAKKALEENISLWNNYDLLSNAFYQRIKEIEAKIKSESSHQIELDAIDLKMAKVQDLKNDVELLKPKLESLTLLCNSIGQENKDIDASQLFNKATVRYNTASNIIETISDRLNNYKTKFDDYNKSNQQFVTWLNETKSYVDEVIKLCEPGTVSSSKVQLQDMKSLLNQIVLRFDELKVLNEKGEALYTGIAFDSRENIRKNLKQIRNTYETMHKKLNSFIKKLDSDVSQKASIEDNHEQIKQWLSDASPKVITSELYKTLQEKKSALHNYKTMLQDFTIHNNLLRQLDEKATSLSDKDSIARIKATKNEYANLIKTIDDRISTCEDHITNHELYDTLIEKLRDEFAEMKNNFDEVINSDLQDIKKVDENLANVKFILNNKPIFDEKLAQCYNQLNTVINQTHEKGHADLFNAFKMQKDEWIKFITMCEESKNKFEKIISQNKKLDTMLTDLLNFIKDKENFVKDQNLKSNLDAKVNHLKALNDILKEIKDMEPVMQKLMSDSRENTFENSNHNKVSHVNIRFQTLENNCKDLINRYEIYCNEHLLFNDNYQEFNSELNKNIEHLKVNFEICGNLDGLYEIQKNIKDLQDKQSNDSISYDQLIASGENLYPHTSHDGREVIRQQLKLLKNNWDNYEEDLNTLGQKVDQFVQQFEEFTIAQEELSKWLREIEKSIQSHTELRSTLPEKNLQLQNHKSIHQEIISQNGLVESVCDKAQQLIDDTKDESIKKYLGSIKELFANIVSKSEDLLNKLNDAVGVHRAYENDLNAIRVWINDENEKLLSCENLQGEKSEIVKKIEKINSILKNKENGTAKMKNLSTKFADVTINTSPKGIEQLSKEFNDIKLKFENLYASVDASVLKQQEVLEQWKQFEEQNEELKKWCKNYETLFKELPQKNNIDEKNELLNTFKANQEIIVQKEMQIDEFTDFANVLFSKSGIEKIKIVTNQILNRYKLLTVLSKEVVNRLQNIANEHKLYQDKFNKIDENLNKMQAQIDGANESADLRSVNKDFIQVFSIEKDKIDDNIKELIRLSEKVFPETGTLGREKIREELRNIREKFEKMTFDYSNLKKNIETKSNQWHAYQENSQQLTKWLNEIESTISEEQQTEPQTSQEIRAKVLKLKSISHEILSHNRLIENLNEKSNLFDNNEKEKQFVVEIKSRYESVKQKCENILKKNEDIINCLQNLNELHKTQMDKQKLLWDRLSIYSDFTGSKNELATKLEKLEKVQAENEDHQIDDIKNFYDANVNILPKHFAENVKFDVEKIQTENEKFKNALQKVILDIKNRIDLWKQYQDCCDALTHILEDTENVLKNFTFKTTFDEKQEQLCTYQQVYANLKQHENKLYVLSDKASELMQSGNDSKTSILVQQIKSRFLSDENAAKEVLKKCEQMVNLHKSFNEKHIQCLNEYEGIKSELELIDSVITTSERQNLENACSKLNSLTEQHISLNQQLNSLIEIAENLYATTDSAGRIVIQADIEQLQSKIEALYDKLIACKTKLEFKLSNISGVESLIDTLENWLNLIETVASGEMQKKTTLDEKTNQQRVYDDLLIEMNAHQKDINVLQNLMTSDENDENVKQKSNELIQKFNYYLSNVKNYAVKYEQIVHDHQQYSVAVMDAQNFIQATHSTADIWSDLDLDKASLKTNLEKISNLNASMPDEYNRVDLVCEYGCKILPDTMDNIQIQQQIDSSKQDWEHLCSTLQTIIESTKNKLDQWNDFDAMRDACLDWIRSLEGKLHSIDLMSSMIEKKSQYNELKEMQGEIRAKELEIDNVTEKSQVLLRNLPNSSSKHAVNELVQKYQQLSQKIKDLTSRWQKYYLTHHEFDQKVSEYSNWLHDLKAKLANCSDLTGNSQSEIENKLTIIQELLLMKEDRSNVLQEIIEAAQAVLANTAAPGHMPINESVSKLHDEWSQCTMKMTDLKSSLSESITQWSGLSDEIQMIRKSTQAIENILNDFKEYQTSMPEKRTQLELIRNIEERVRLEKLEVDNLKARTLEMIVKGKSSVAQLAQEVLNNFDNVFEKVKKLLSDREEQYRDHKTYKEAFDNLQNYINRAKEKIPAMQQISLGEKASIEQSVSPLDSLLNKRAQGDLLLEHLQSTAEVVLCSTSNEGQVIIKNDLKELKQCFEDLFKEIRLQKDKMQDTMLRWKDYKDEYEKYSEWLTQMDILVKNNKLALHPTLQDKKKQVTDMKDIMVKIEKQQDEFDRFNAFAEPLLKSHLDSTVSNQLRQLNSKYQVLLNIAKDVMKKVENNCNQHHEFEDYAKRAKNWLQSAKDIIQSCSEGNVTNRDAILSKLNNIQNLIDRRDEGQSLVQNTVNSGEKTLKNTKSDGKEDINNQMKQIQSEWDRIAKKMTSSKVNLETQLLQWADYSSSYNQLQQWINDREAKLEQVTKQRTERNHKGKPALVERKANLRQTNDIVQDIVSFEPMVQSVTSKASELHLQGVPDRELNQISSKYENLTKQAKEIFAKQKDDVEKMQAFLDAGNEFAYWIRNAKEELNKCSEPIGDKDTLISKLTQIKVLENDLPNGQSKLEKVLELAKIALQDASPEDRCQIEEEVGLMQGEQDSYVAVISHSKKQLEFGIAKWTEFDKKLEDATKWLGENETTVQQFNKLQSNLEGKRIALEKFQQLLQTLFDWQRDLDDFNMTAQTLLDICSDTRISNVVTQLTTKYNAILSISKEIMKRLEVQYQEHQQHNALMQELCDEWLEKVQEKLNLCYDVPLSISELQLKINTLKNIRQTLEQGQNKFRYALELKEKVIVNTESSGVAKIEEDAENLNQSFNKLMNDVSEVKMDLNTKLNMLEEINKQYKVFTEWLADNMQQIPSDDKLYTDLSDKKATLEKLRGLQRECVGYNDICEKLKAKLVQDNINTNEFEGGIKQFQEFKDLLEAKIGELENFVNDHERYKQSLTEIYNWIKSTKRNIEECSDSHGDKETILDKISKLQTIEQSIPEGKILLNHTTELSNKFLSTCDSEGQDSVKQEIKHIDHEWKHMLSMWQASLDNLEDCKNLWNAYSNKSEEINLILTKFKSQIAKFDISNEIVTDDEINSAKVNTF
jgi:nesprin-1